MALKRDDVILLVSVLAVANWALLALRISQETISSTQFYIVPGPGPQA